MTARRTRLVALGLGLAWACLWVFFETAEAIGTRQFGQAIIFIVVMFGTVVLAWKWPLIRGVLFLLEGSLAIAMFAPAWTHRFHLAQFALLFAMMPAPPLLAGALLLLSRKTQHA